MSHTLPALELSISRQPPALELSISRQPLLSLISIASNELESDSISGWNLTQAYNNRLDLGAYRTYYKGFTCFFNNTVLRGAGLNGCAIFVRKYWDRTV